MDIRRDSRLSHVFSWCKKVARVKSKNKIYPSLIPKTEYLFDLRDSVKEEMIKELMLGTTRTKEYLEWLIKVREFEISANKLLKFKEKTSDNLRFSMKQPHADLKNALDEITRLLESSPLQAATITMSSSMIEGKSFGLSERAANAYLRRKDQDEAFLEAGRSHAMGKEVENENEMPPDKYFVKKTLMASSSIKPEGGQPFVSVESQVINEAGSVTTVGSMVDMQSPISGNSGVVSGKASAAVKDPLLPTDEISSSSVDPLTTVERTVLKILQLLSDGTVRRIGVYGFGGVGKTTALKAFINHPQTKDMFDLIIWVSVSQHWSIRKMQQEVLRQLPVHFEVDSKIGEELFRYLEGWKFLLILDDVWERIDLEAVGIPDPSSGNGCALILSTRKWEVCEAMRLINVIEVETVSNEEPWELYRKQVGRIADAPGIQSFAQFKGSSGVVSGKAFAAVKDPLLPTDEISSSSVDPVTKHGVVSSSRNDNLPAPGYEIELISFEEEMKPSLSPENSKTMLYEIEEISSSHETESETDLPAASQISLITVKQSVEPTIEVVASTSRQSNINTVEPLAVGSLIRDEILVTDEMETDDPCQTEVRLGFCEPEVDAKTTVERTVLKILELLNDDSVRRIGVYGSGGAGKTTVLKAFINHPHTKDMFDLIIWVTVSKYWSIRKMQHEVLRQLPTDFEADSEIGEELFRYLEGRKFLLVLDDVWEKIDLEAVGIPDPSSGNGCTLILATRKSEVCNDMHLINVVEVETVSNEEAWELFREQVGGIVDAPGIQSFAQGIVQGCGGLPLLVIVTGRALSGEENVFAWEQAFRQFSGPCRDPRNQNDIIQLLKFSFDRLEVHDIQSCFLHCALFAEDQEINISEFVKYSIEEGLIAGITADAYKRGHDIVDVLVRAFLLERTINYSIKMHDMMRDLALGILSQGKGSQFLLRAYSKGNHALPGPHESPESNRFFIPDGNQFILRAGSGLTQVPSLEEWEKSNMIFLMDNNLSTLPERPSCPGLLTLFLQRNFRLRVIPTSFFDNMSGLKVLNLTNTRIKCLPKTISKLISLETLILRRCERLGILPSDIGSLKHLQILDLRGTEINILPDEIGELASLTYLDVCFYGSINRSEYVKLPQGLISSGIISRLNALQSLGIRVCPGDERWDKCVKSIVSEVCKLTGLTSLSFYFPEVEHLELFLQKSVAWIDQRLIEYNFVVGHDIKRIVSRVPHYVELDYGLISQCLRFVNGEKIPAAIVKVLPCCSAFYLDHHLDISSISKFGIGNMNKLKYCIVSECPAVLAILDKEEFTEAVFPCLEHLSIHYLWNLEYICKGVVPEGSFAMLRILYVHACPKLKYVMKSSMLQFITNLEELIVDDCISMEKIIFNDMTTESSHISNSSFRRLTLHYLPALDNIREGVWPLFEDISVCNCPNFKKINLDSDLKHTLKGIKGEKNWWDSLEWKEPALRMHFEDRFTPVSEDDI